MIIKVSQEFNFNGKGLWIGGEKESVSGIDEVSQYVALHETLKEAFKAISGQTMTDYNTGAPSSTHHIIDRGKETMKEIIQDCKTTLELEQLVPESIAKYCLQEEYNQRYSELTK